MRHRFWPFIYLGVTAGAVSAILAALDEPALLIFASVLAIIVVFALILEALRDPIENAEPAEDTPLPPGFGRVLLEQMPLALMVISPKGRVVYGNQAAYKLLPNLTVGSHFVNLFRAPDFVDAVNAAINDGESSNVSFTTTHGRERYFETRVGLLPEGSEFGDSVQAIVEIEDRTRHRQAENMRSDFIANASHELRTPLASIIGYIETLQGHAKNDAEAREQFLGIMGKQASRMQRLVDDLMSLGRIEMNAHIPPDEECDLFEIAREAVSALLPLQEKYGATLTCDIPTSDARVTGDRDQLSQVFINLVDNAMKYGGGEVTISVAEPVSKYADKIGISVVDNGKGIPKQHIHRLTERFYRVNATQSKSKGGTGLGLAIVKHIINRHHGNLRIESKMNSGSKFTVWLPKIIVEN